MHRFYIPSQNISSTQIIIQDKKQLHHLNVLRLKARDEIIIFDEQGNEYHCCINRIRDKVILAIQQKKRFPNIKPVFAITVACALPKKSKMDDIIDKLTQLGVERIIPLDTQRTEVKLDEQTKEIRLQRWMRIILSASQQSQRNILPILEPIQNISKILLRPGEFDLKLMPTLEGKREALREVLDKTKPKNILILVGPEGDFSPREIALAKDSGFLPVSLGKLVLRVETAAVAVASFIRLYYENN